MDDSGQVTSLRKFKDGKVVSGKHWKSKGEEVETAEEAAELPAYPRAGTMVQCTG